jgi:hypothetical protein
MTLPFDAIYFFLILCSFLGDLPFYKTNVELSINCTETLVLIKEFEI